MNKDRICCLTLDLEADHGLYSQDNYYIIENNLNNFIEIINLLSVKLTIFVTGAFFKRFPELILKLKETLDCEFALHSYFHGTNDKIERAEEIVFSYEKYVNFFQSKPEGYRSPYGKITKEEINILKDLGFKYHSFAGWFFTLKGYLSPYRDSKGIYLYPNKLIEIPVSRIPILGIPIGMGYVNFLNIKFIKYIFNFCNPLIIYFHLHDLFKTKAFKELPFLWRIFYFNKELIASKPHMNFVNIINYLKRKKYKFLLMKDLIKDDLNGCL